MHHAQVDSAWDRGDHEDALSSSNQAKTWNIVGIVCGSIIYGLVILIIIISAIAGGGDDDEDE